MVAAILALLLALPAMAGTLAIDRFGGLHDADSPATISSGGCQDCINVETNLYGTSLLKRRGFTREASLTISTGPVTGAIEWTCDNGDNIVVVCHDHFCAKSVNGTAFSNFNSTVSANVTRWSFVTVDGDLYGANDQRQAVMKYDCTSLTHPSEIPAGSILALTEDRLVVADTSANPNRIAYSKSGDFTEFTAASASEDPFTDDLGAPGERTTGMVYNQGILWRFTRQSITACETGDQYTQRCSVFSPNVGTQDPNSIVVAASGVYFRGTDRAYWGIVGGQLGQVSKRIYNFTRNQLTGAQRSNTQTTQSDWANGTQSPSSSWDTTTLAGSIFPSSVTFIDTSSTNFNAGTLTGLSLTDVVGSVVLSSTTARDDFSDGNYTGGLMTWTVSQGGFSASSGKLLATGDNGNDALYNQITNTDVKASSGSWQFTFAINNNATLKFCDETTGANDCFDFRFSRKDASNYYSFVISEISDTSLAKNIYLKKTASASTTVLAATTVDIDGNGVAVTFNIIRNADGSTFLYADSVFKSSFTDTAITSPTGMEAQFAGTSDSANYQLLFDDFNFYAYQSPGQLVSQSFDTTRTAPILGTFNSTFTRVNGLAADGNIAFYTQTSANGTDWNTVATTSDTLRPTSVAQRYVRYRADFTTAISTKTPQLDAVSLIAATTGQFKTQCIEPGSGISTWGVISCDQTTAGAGSITIAMSTGSTCANALNAVYYDQTNNATVTNGVGAATHIRFTSLLGSATDQAQVNACTLYWNEGTVAQPVWGAFDSVNNAIYWTATTTSATQGNRVIKYDLNLDEFFPFDLQATALLYRTSGLYFGSSNGGYWNKYGAAGQNSDNGSSINAYWKSKDFGGDDPFVEKDWQKISLVAKNNVTGNFTVNWADSFAKTGSYTVSLATSTSITYVRSSHSMQKRSPSNFLNVQIGNNSQTPFEVLGLRVDFAGQPWRVNNP